MLRYSGRIGALTLLVLVLATALCLPVRADAPNQMLASDSFSNIRRDQRNKEPLWNNHHYMREDVEAMIFHAEMMELPKDAWDLSADRDGSVMGWMSEKTLHICADGGVTLNKNSSWLFSGFINLESIDFGGGVHTEEVVDLSHMFSECVKLTELDLTGFDLSHAENISCMFYNCTSLRRVNLTGWNAERLRVMDKLFAFCTSLEEVNLTGLNTAQVTNLSNLFYRCRSLKRVDVSSFQTGSNLYLNGMFYGCESLEYVDVSGFDTSNVIGMNYVFADCPNLRTPDVSHFNVSKVQSCLDFMDPGREINGRPWQEFFGKTNVAVG